MCVLQPRINQMKKCLNFVGINPKPRLQPITIKYLQIGFGILLLANILQYVIQILTVPIEVPFSQAPLRILVYLALIIFYQAVLLVMKYNPKTSQTLTEIFTAVMAFMLHCVETELIIYKSHSDDQSPSSTIQPQLISILIKYLILIVYLTPVLQIQSFAIVWVVPPLVYFYFRFQTLSLLNVGDVALIALLIALFIAYKYWKRGQAKQTSLKPQARTIPLEFKKELPIKLEPEKLINLLPEGVIVFQNNERVIFQSDPVQSILDCSRDLALQKLMSLPLLSANGIARKLTEFVSTDANMIGSGIEKDSNKIAVNRITGGLQVIPETKGPAIDINPDNKALKLKDFQGISINEQQAAQSSDPEIVEIKLRVQDEPSGKRKFSLFSEHEDTSNYYMKKRTDKVKETRTRDLAEEFTISDKMAQFQSFKVKEQLGNLTRKLQKNDFQTSCGNVKDLINLIFKEMEKKFHTFKIAEAQASLAKSPLLQENDSNKSNQKGKRKILLPSKQAEKDPNSPKSPNTDFLYLLQNLNANADQCIVVRCEVQWESNLSKQINIKFNPLIWKGRLCITVILGEVNLEESARLTVQTLKQQQAAFGNILNAIETPLRTMAEELEALSKIFSREQFSKRILPLTSAMQSKYLSISNLYYVQKILADQPKAFITSCLIQEIFQSALNFIQLRAQAKGLAVRTEIGDEVPKIIYTDPDRMVFILMNLLSNALEHTTKGSIVLKAVSIKRAYIKISVKDTGTGLNPEKFLQVKSLLELKEPQWDMILSQPNDFNGIGLLVSNALVQQICPKNDGSSIRFNSNVDEGSEFFFLIEDSIEIDENFNNYSSDFEEIGQKMDYLKQVSLTDNFSEKNKFNTLENSSGHSVRFASLKHNYFSQNNQVLSKKQTLIHIVKKFKKSCDCPKILIVDSFEHEIRILKAIFEAMGIRKYQAVRNGDECLDLLNSLIGANKACCNSFFELIIINLASNPSDGFRTSKEIADLITKGVIPPQNIIGIADNISEEFFDKCKDAGIQDVMEKPVTSEQLQGVLAKIVLIPL